MIIRKCDRCGKEIQEYTYTQTEYPYYQISVKNNIMRDSKYIDFCPNCQKELTKWMNSKENKE